MSNRRGPEFGPTEHANTPEDDMRRVILGDSSWKPVPEEGRTPISEVPYLVNSGENWTVYSDGATLYYVGDTPFYLE